MNNRIARITGSVFLCSALGAASTTAHAASYRWIGSDNGAWNSAANWAPRGVPSKGDSASIGGKRKVSVSTDATIANLSVGAGAEIKNGGHLKVTGKTSSSGVFTGAGTLTVPTGATATFNVDGSGLSRQSKGLRGCALPHSGSASTVVFPSLINNGHVITNVAKGSRVAFSSIQNSGSLRIVSNGAATFQNIKNNRRLDISGTGTLSLAKVENTAGASLFIAATTPVNSHATSSAVQLDTLINRSGGKVTLQGRENGRSFDGKSIRNEGQMKIVGAQTALESDVFNTAGATLSLEGNAQIFSSDSSAPKLNNAGTLVKSAGSDATLNVEWNNTGEVVVENGTLHVRVPAGKACKQLSGTTTLEGGTLSLEDALGLTSNGTYEVAGGVLDGIGTIEGNLKNSGGHLKPGHSPGSITINGNYFQTNNGILDMEIGGTTPGTTYDQMLVNGTAYLGGTLNVIRWGNYVPAGGEFYILFEYFTRVGNFAQVLDALPLTGLTYEGTLTPTTYELSTYASGPIDTSPPTATIASPLNNAASPSITGATGTASDSVGLSNVTCRLYRYSNPVTGVPAAFWAGGTSWTATATSANEEPATGTTSWSFGFPALVAGRYSLRATATDTSGNNAYSATVAFWVDPNAPSVVTINAPLAGANLTSIGTISGTASDASNGSGILLAKGQLRRNSDGLYWNGSTWAAPFYSFSLSLSGINWSRSPSFPTGANLLPGSYSIIITATDKAGNTKAVGNNFNIVAPLGDAGSRQAPSGGAS